MNQTVVNSKTNLKTTDLVMTGMFTAIICVMAIITIPTQPIPFTLSLFAIFLTGALLTPRNAFLAVVAYLLIGTCGVPVFAGLKSGPQVLTGMTGGYLMAYPIMALITALFYKYFKKHRIISLALGMTVALIACYLVGTLWFSYVSGNSFYKSLFLCVVPYVLFDFLKIILAISIGLIIRKTVYKPLGIL